MLKHSLMQSSCILWLDISDLRNLEWAVCHSLNIEKQIETYIKPYARSHLTDTLPGSVGYYFVCLTVNQSLSDIR